MATKKEAEQKAAAEAAAAEAAAQKEAAEAPQAIAHPASADTPDSASGAVVEPAIVEGVEMDHPAIDANPRAGTTALMNARDMNDPLNRRPADEDYIGKGLDPSVYGKG